MGAAYKKGLTAENRSSLTKVKSKHVTPDVKEQEARPSSIQTKLLFPSARVGETSSSQTKSKKVDQKSSTEGPRATGDGESKSKELKHDSKSKSGFTSSEHKSSSKDRRQSRSSEKNASSSRDSRHRTSWNSTKQSKSGHDKTSVSTKERVNAKSEGSSSDRSHKRAPHTAPVSSTKKRHCPADQ